MSDSLKELIKFLQLGTRLDLKDYALTQILGKFQNQTHKHKKHKKFNHFRINWYTRRLRTSRASRRNPPMPSHTSRWPEHNSLQGFLLDSSEHLSEFHWCKSVNQLRHSKTTHKPPTKVPRQYNQDINQIYIESRVSLCWCSMHGLQ